MEEEYALEKARNRLLTLELKELKREQKSRVGKPEKVRAECDKAQRDNRKQVSGSSDNSIRTKRKQIFFSARQRAETKFAALQEGIKLDKEGR
ncbi:MAG: hypothetical protein K5905_17045 [Roseibium sp.]|uniref:hypothetical protein n=1 Tax=Roseibium sp. TaxID=1936156 RepID=UPI0026379D39|nr:hypothetical protein [Roseibium sp.]MCV0427170.1 hypothetical protein [Roseibium sp.]